MRDVIEFLFPGHLMVSVDYDSDINIFDKKFTLTNFSKEKLVAIRGERKRGEKVKVPMKIINRGYPEGYDYKERIKTTYQAEEEIKKANCRPAIINELIALGEKHPGLQHEYDIVALGTCYSLFTPGVGKDFIFQFCHLRMVKEK